MTTLSSCFNKLTITDLPLFLIEIGSAGRKENAAQQCKWMMQQCPQQEHHHPLLAVRWEHNDKGWGKDLLPSLPQSLITRPVVINSLLSWKTGIRSRRKLPKFKGKWSMTWHTTYTHRQAHGTRWDPPKGIEEASGKCSPSHIPSFASSSG